MDKLLGRISRHEICVGVVGLGYVGLPLACEFAEAGFKVCGVDIDKDKIKALNKGESYVLDVPSGRIKRLLDEGKISFSHDYSILSKADAISIAVPTPLRKSKDPDVSYIVSAVSEIKKRLHKNLLIVLESTTYPGTTRELVVNEVEKAGFVPGKDIFVAFSPERVDPGNKHYNTKNTPKVIGGYSEACNRVAYALYSSVIDHVVMVDSTEEAEMVKLLENTFRAVNIALVNEMALMSDRMGMNIWNVIEAASTKPFGFMSFYPGPGIGGHCIPLDPSYLSWKAKMFNFYNRFIELATDINGNMPRFVVQKIIRLLNTVRKPLSGSKILLLGIAYKPDIDDLRESPALELYRLLTAEDASVEFHDPYVESFIDRESTVKGVSISEKSLAKYDLVVVTTNHKKKIDYDMVLTNANLIFDTRNAYSSVKSGKVIRL